MPNKMNHNLSMPANGKAAAAGSAKQRIGQGFRGKAVAVLSLGFRALSLAACAATGPEPVAFDQNPGSNGAPTASSN